MDCKIPDVYAVSGGSYPRIGSEAGKALRKAKNAKNLATREEVSAAEAAVAREIIGEQIESGLDIITDGLVRWDCPISHIAGRMEGVSIGALHHFLDTNFHVRKAMVDSLPEWKTPLVADELRFMRSITETPLKAVLTGPATFLRYAENKTAREKYILGSAYTYALCDEIELLLSLQGVSIIQIDDPCILDEEYAWGEYRNWYGNLYRTITKNDSEVLLELKTYGKKSAETLPELFALPCDYLGLDCAADKKIILRILQNPAWLRDTGRGLALGIVDARSSIMEDPFMLERIVEPLLLYAERPLFLEPSCGLEFLPRRFARGKCGILAKTKRLLCVSALFEDTMKMLEKKEGVDA